MGRGTAGMLLALGLGLGNACAGDGATGGACLDPLPDCTPSFAPTFDAFHRNALASCVGRACHGADGARGDLVLEGAEAAYSHLLGEADGQKRVIPGDPECSILVQRLESTDPDFVMPRGGQLDPGARCAVRKWIEAGAPRHAD